METALILLEGAVVIGAILLGVRMGGIGLGLWGLVGLAVLIFVFGLPPGSPPTSSMFIILMVITAASTMQAVGGIDYLVEVAKAILKKRPSLIALVAPVVAFIFTLGAGTGFIYYSLIPVIFAVSYANRVRPERPLAVAGTASQFAITASPVSAAMATLVGLLGPAGFEITDILIVILPASIVGLLVASFVQMRVGKELVDDPVYKSRVAAGDIPSLDSSVLEARALPKYAKRSTFIFLAGIVVIMILGIFEQLRPAFPDENGELVPLETSIVIQIVMGIVATLIVITCRANIKTIVTQPTMTSGLVGLIALFGIAWLADTWISANEAAIVNAMGGLVEAARWTIALAIFIVAALTTSQAAAIAAIVPIGLALGLPPQFLAAFSVAAIGIYFFPAKARRSPASRRTRREPRRSAGSRFGTRSRCRCSSCGSCPPSSHWSWRRSCMGPDHDPAARHDRARRAGRADRDAGRSRGGECRRGGRFRRVYPERQLRVADRRRAGAPRWERRP